MGAVRCGPAVLWLVAAAAWAAEASPAHGEPGVSALAPGLTSAVRKLLRSRHLDVDSPCGVASMVCGIALGATPCRPLLRLCVGGEEPWETIADSEPAPAPFDLRVSKALGSKGYGKVRVSVVSELGVDTLGNSSNWDYASPFRYRWRHLHVRSREVDVAPGTTVTEIDVDGAKVPLRHLPVEGEGVRGLLWADPCFSSRYVACKWGAKFKTFERATELLNVAAASDSSLAFWYLLGDIFYDRDGDLTKAWFDRLTLDAKALPLVTTTGNHDVWVGGAPIVGVLSDQYLNGVAQFFGQDAMSSVESDNGFLDLSIDPNDGGWKPPLRRLGRQAHVSNFFTYHLVGNVGTIAYSGSHSYESQAAYIEEACEYFADRKPAVVLLVGHWSTDDDGCVMHNDVPSLHKRLTSDPASKCSALGRRLKYVQGHEHCNEVVEPNTGFMVAGHGMSGCGQFGAPIVDTTQAGRVRVLYYPLADRFGLDRYEMVRDCVAASGFGGCEHLAQVWMDEPVPELP